MNGTEVASGKVDESWTDLLFGLTHAYALSDTVAWTSRVDYGVMGSEGTLFVDTGITWRFRDAWSARFYASSLAHDYEEGDPGDSDYYVYDVDEFGAGISILYHF